MKIVLYGTRGSTPGMPRGSHQYGGNTTCLRIVSDCIPNEFGFAVDAGSGFVQLSRDLMKEGKKNVAVLFTHWHHDHTQGLCLAPHTFASESFHVWGPQEHNFGPRRTLETLFKSPLFPVDFPKLAHRFKLRALENIGTQVFIVHPKGGFVLMGLQHFTQAKRQVAFPNGKFDLGECLVVRMWKTAHPEYTVSYRIEERPTGKVFVFLTDQEKQATIGSELRAHLSGADLLVMDAQYPESLYPVFAGFGHGTPEYCAETAAIVGVNRLGLTHHDPTATDDDIDRRVLEASVKARALKHEADIFACADYMTLDI
jgi:ribonuclease BN (tRNA processing enzyme)